MSTPATRRTPDAVMVKLRAWHLDRFGLPVEPEPDPEIEVEVGPTDSALAHRVLASQQRERTAVDGLSGHGERT